MRKQLYCFFVIPVFILSCSKLVKDEHLPALSDLEKPVYIMKTDVKLDERILTKGQHVRIIIVPGDEWIKVYAYPAESDPLKAERVNVLYLFEDDFKDEKFDMAVFRQKLGEIVEEYTAPPVAPVPQGRKAAHAPSAKKAVPATPAAPARNAGQK